MVRIAVRVVVIVVSHNREPKVIVIDIVKKTRYFDIDIEDIYHIDPKSRSAEKELGRKRVRYTRVRKHKSRRVGMPSVGVC